MVNGTTEVLFAGQPCLSIHKSGVNEGISYHWRINPVFAKLVYGANIFEDIPCCDETLETVEESVAAGLVKLHELGAFNTEYDFPEDTYAATMNTVAEDVKVHARSISKNIFEASLKYVEIMDSIKNYTFERDSRSEFTANIAINGEKSPIAPIDKKPKHKLKSPSGAVISSHDTEGEATRAFNNLSNSRGVKIVKESDDGEIDITPVTEKVSIFSKWRKETSGTQTDE